MIDLYTDGNFTKEELDTKVTPIAEQETELRDKIKELSRPNEEIQRDIDDIEQSLTDIKGRIKLHEQLKETNNNENVTRAELLEDVKKITITSNRRVLVTYKFEWEFRKYFKKYMYILPPELREEFNRNYTL